MLTEEQLNKWLTLKHELPEVECKGPGSLKDNPLKGKVVRAAMGMANRRGGGTVIVGVAERDHVLYPDGLSDDQLRTWRYEDIADALNAYADPPISFDYHPRSWNGKNFLILQIHQFRDVPIVCKKDYRDDSDARTPEKNRKMVLREGRMYMRSPNKPETIEVSTVEGMRTVLGLVKESDMNDGKSSVSNRGDIHIKSSITGSTVQIGHGASNVNQTIPHPLDRAALKASLLELFEVLGNAGLPIQTQMEAQTATGLAAQQAEAPTPQVEALVQHLQQVGQSLQRAKVSVEDGSQLGIAVTKLAQILGPVVGDTRVVAGWFGIH